MRFASTRSDNKIMMEQTNELPEFDEELSTIYGDSFLMPPSSSVPVELPGSHSFDMTDKKFHGLLELACSVMEFEVGEIWLVKNHEDVKERSFQFRQIHITQVSEEQRSHLECPDPEGRVVDESKHKISPILCRNACDSGQVVWVNAKACEGLVVTAQSTLPLHTATAVPCYPSGQDHMFVLVLFSARHCQITFQAIDFLCAITRMVNDDAAASSSPVSGGLRLKESTSNLDLQKYYIEKSATDLPPSAHQGDGDGDTVNQLPIMFFGEPDSLVDIKKHSEATGGLEDLTADLAKSDRYSNFLSGVLQLTSFDIAEIWLPEDAVATAESPLKLVTSLQTDASMQPWADFSRLLALAPGLDLPGSIVTEQAPLVDTQYKSHEPLDAKYPRALNAKFLGIEVAFGIPIAGSSQTRGAFVFYSKTPALVPEDVLRLLTCGAALLARGAGVAGAHSYSGSVVLAGTSCSVKSESDNIDGADVTGLHNGMEEGKESKDLIDLAFMSALDTVLDDDANWDFFGNESGDAQPPQQSPASAKQSMQQQVMNADHQFKNLTSRVFSETVASGSSTNADMMKKSRTRMGSDISNGVVQNIQPQLQPQLQQQEYHQQQQQNLNQQQRRQYQQHEEYLRNYQYEMKQQRQQLMVQQQQLEMRLRSSETPESRSTSLSNCINCQKLSETVNGYCKNCTAALAAYFSRNNGNFGRHTSQSFDQPVFDPQYAQQLQQQQATAYQGQPRAPVPFPTSHGGEAMGWDQQPQRTFSPRPLGSQFEMRKFDSSVDPLDVSHHSHQSDLDVSQHSTASSQSPRPPHMEGHHGLDLHNFRSTLDIGRNPDRFHNTSSDPLDVQYHPVNVSRYHFINSSQRNEPSPSNLSQANLRRAREGNFEVIKQSNSQSADYELDQTHHPVNVDRYHHTYGDFANQSTHSVDSMHSTMSERTGKVTSKRKICRFEGCLEVAIFRSPYCSTHAGNRKCLFEGCTKCAQGSTRYCISHGGGRRCTFPGCNKGARDKFFCAAHGGGKRCTVEGCVKSAVGRSSLCTSHGGGKRCMEPGCTKSSQSSTMYCVRHGGGRKCALIGCNKVARGRTNFCASHKQQTNSGAGDSSHGSPIREASISDSMEKKTEQSDVMETDTIVKDPGAEMTDTGKGGSSVQTPGGAAQNFTNIAVSETSQPDIVQESTVAAASGVVMI
mmetsp:Transcript_353/g.843  ORF Transcript_353/g.843 Transcript_353/m.843 type:complete len:1183 (-) Transcript_353:2064-5612(-)